MPVRRADVDFLGVTGTFTDIPDDQRECPSIGMTGFSGTGGAVNAYTASNQPMWDISNTTTWVSGSHTLNFGFNYRRWWLQRDLATGFLGNYTFNVGFTGNRVADMLLGYYSGVGIFQPAAFSVPGAAGNPREFNFKYLAPYFQDDWRVSSRLTVNLGLRWDYRNVPYETRNRMAWRNLDYARRWSAGGRRIAGRRRHRRRHLLPVRGPAQPGEPGSIQGVRTAGRRSPGGRSAKRPSSAAATACSSTRPKDAKSTAPPTSIRTSAAATTSSRSASRRRCRRPTPCSRASRRRRRRPANTFLAVSQSPEPRNPYMQQWSLGVQRELMPRTTMEVNYIGTHGTNLLMRRNIAQARLVRPGQSAVGRRPQAVPELRGLHRQRLEWPIELQRAQHQARASRAGSILTFAYTWARSTDLKSAAAGIGASGFNGWQGFLDNSDPERDYGLSDFDVDHRLVGSFVYNLPFGSGEKYATNATGVKNAVVGGWQVNGIYTWQRGFPITITAADLGGLNDTFGTNRADLVGDPSVDERKVDQWFNTAAFRQPAAGVLGNLGRNTERGPGVNNFDLALFKNFSFTHGMRVQFRLESFNAFNHTQFSGVGTNLAAGNFGVVTSARAARINQLGSKFLF